MDTIILANGVNMPILGYGTFKSPNDENTVQAIVNALQLGYRHIDTASVYGNEEAVGEAIMRSGIPRREIFLTTKLWNNVRGYTQTKQALEESLNRLCTDYVDLYLLHWPVPFKYSEDYNYWNIESWRAMEELYRDGKVRAIGVSNFLEHHLREFQPHLSIQPMVDQIEFHPTCQQRETVEYCLANGIAVEAWSPIGRGQDLTIPVINEIAERVDSTPAQVILAWELQSGIVPLPKALRYDKQTENLVAPYTVLGIDDIEQINALECDKRVGSHPDRCNF